MPQAIIWAVNYLAVAGAISVGTAVAIGTFVASYGAGLLLIGGLAYSSAKERQAKQASKDQYNAAQVDRLVNISSAVAPRELVLGRVRKGGTVIYKASTGSVNRSMFVVIALAAHEVDAIEEIYLNDTLVNVDVDGGVTTAPYWRETNEWGPAASYVRITKHLGQPGQTADPRLIEAFPDAWGASNTLTGIAYLVVEGFYAETAFPSGFPSVSAVVRGAKLYDPRTGLTAWSENPALMLRHVYSHEKFGKAVVTSAEDASVIAAANACDSSVSYGGAAACALYRASLVLPFGTAAKSAFDDLAQAMGGSWAYMGGALYLKAGVYTSPVMTLTEADLAVVQRSGANETQQPIAITVHKERAQKFNTVKARIWDQAQDYKQVSLTPLVGAALVARDGAELSQELTFPAIGHAPQALHVAGVMMRDARDALVVVLPVKLRAHPLRMFDTVSLTLPRYGWEAKTFVLLGRTWNSDGSLQLTLKETSAAITQMDAEFLPQGHAPNTNLPKPWEVALVGPLSISSGTAELLLQADGTVVSRMRVSWPAVADAAVQQNGHIEVQYRPVGGPLTWATEVVQGNETAVAISDVMDGVYYTVRARATTSVGVGAWSAYMDVQVLGKTEPPQDVTSFSVSGDTLNWVPVTDLDLSGYLLRFNYGSSFSWDTATPMHIGVITESPYVMVTRPSGAVTIMIKAVDTSGNVSVNAAAVATNLADPPVANVVEQIDFGALGYPGTLLNCTVVGGELVADSQGSAGSSDYGLTGTVATTFGDYGTLEEGVTTSVDWGDAGVFDALEYVSSEIVVSQALSGSLATLAISATGESFQVYYRLSGPGSFYEADGMSFYGSDGTAFYGPPGPWVAWPGQLAMANDTYQFRVKFAVGATQGRISSMVLTVDAPDIIETVDDLVVSAGGTAIPYSKPFSSIKNVQVTLQTNGSGAETVEVDKSSPLTPVIRAYNSSHVAVSGASVDITLKGY